MTQECAMVPSTEIPYSFPARVFDVPIAPPINAARLAESAPSAP